LIYKYTIELHLILTREKFVTMGLEHPLSTKNQTKKAKKIH